MIRKLVNRLWKTFCFICSIAPPEIQVACFVGADNLKEVLGDFTDEIKWDNTDETVKKCAKKAYEKHFNLFALGKDGLCLSGADMKQKYHLSGTYGANCKDGIGMGNSMFVYSLGKHCFFFFSFICSFFVLFCFAFCLTNMN